MYKLTKLDCLFDLYEMVVFFNSFKLILAQIVMVMILIITVS
jgi:hypothetical protein